MAPTTRLFRPLDLPELKGICDSGYGRFPTRQTWQPIFYPVADLSYAEQIAYECHVNASSGYGGFVVQFDVEERYMDSFKLPRSTNATFQEFRIPAESLPELNRQLQGDIQLVSSFYTSDYRGIPIKSGELKGLNIYEQVQYVHSLKGNQPRIRALIVQYEFTILTNLNYWKHYCPEMAETVQVLEQLWAEYRPQQVSTFRLNPISAAKL